MRNEIIFKNGRRVWTDADITPKVLTELQTQFESEVTEVNRKPLSKYSVLKAKADEMAKHGAKINYIKKWSVSYIDIYRKKKKIVIDLGRMSNKDDVNYALKRRGDVMEVLSISELYGKKGIKTPMIDIGSDNIAKRGAKTGKIYVPWYIVPSNADKYAKNKEKIEELYQTINFQYENMGKVDQLSEREVDRLLNELKEFDRQGLKMVFVNYYQGKPGVSETISDFEAKSKLGDMPLSNFMNDLFNKYPELQPRIMPKYKRGAKTQGVEWDKDSDSIRTQLGEFQVTITPQMQKGYYDVYVSANKKQIGKKYDVYGLENAKDIAFSMISNSNKVAEGDMVGNDNTRYPRKADDTGKGIMEGWVIGDGNAYYEKEENALKSVKELGYKTIEEAYDNDEIYFTDWYDEDLDEQGYYYTANGKEVQISSKGSKLGGIFTTYEIYHTPSQTILTFDKKTDLVKDVREWNGKHKTDITIDGILYRKNPVHKTFNSIDKNELLSKQLIKKNYSFGKGGGVIDDNWEMVMDEVSDEGSVGRILKNGKVVGQYEFDRSSDAFWIDPGLDKGQMSFDTKAELIDYYKESNKFANGGSIEKENAEMVLNNNKQISHHTQELASAVKGKSVPAWVVAKVNRSATDLSDATHYLEGTEKAKRGTKIRKSGFVIKYTDENGLEQTRMSRYKDIPEIFKTESSANFTIKRVPAFKIGKFTNPRVVPYLAKAEHGAKTSKGFMVFNYTDDIYASPDTFPTKAKANEFIAQFRKRFEGQGYYRDNRMNKVAPKDIDLLAIPEEFNPYKKN